MFQITGKHQITGANRLLNKLTHQEEPGMLQFSNEKHFVQYHRVNRMNVRWRWGELCEISKEVPTIIHTKFPAFVMVPGVECRVVDEITPYLFPQDLRIHATSYIEVLDTFVKPQITAVKRGTLHVFQQDSAPSHTVHTTQE